jgi:Uma2 family endonuclease
MSAVMSDWMSRHRFTVDEYYRMAEAGLLAPDSRVELIEGEIIDMAPIGSLHGGTVMQLSQLMVRAVGDRAIVSTQLPVRLGRFSEPEPDLALLKWRADFYKSRHPDPADVMLVIEASESSVRYDRQIKIPLYARHGIPEVWIVDLKGKQVHFYRSPREQSYLEISSTDRPGVVAPVALPEVAIDLSGVLTS